MFLFSIHFINDFVKRMFSVPIKSGRPMVAPTNLFFICHLSVTSWRLSSRRGSLAPIAGVLSAMPTVVWLFYFYFRHRSVTSWHLSSRRGFSAPIEELSTQLTEVWLCCFYYRHHSVTSWHLSSGRGSLAPIEGSFQHSWLRGGFYRRSCAPSHTTRATNGRPYEFQ